MCACAQDRRRALNAKIGERIVPFADLFHVFSKSYFSGIPRADKFRDKRIYDSEDGDPEQHAEYAEGAAAYGDCRENPETRQPDGFAVDPRIDQIALYLLVSQGKPRTRTP